MTQMLRSAGFIKTQDHDQQQSQSCMSPEYVQCAARTAKGLWKIASHIPSCLHCNVFADNVVDNDIQPVADALYLCVPLQQLLRAAIEEHQAINLINGCLHQPTSLQFSDCCIVLRNIMAEAVCAHKTSTYHTSVLCQNAVHAL